MTISGNNAEETLVGRIIQRIYILEKITRIDYIRWGIRRVWFCCKDVLVKKEFQNGCRFFSPGDAAAPNAPLYILLGHRQTGELMGDRETNPSGS